MKSLTSKMEVEVAFKDRDKSVTDTKSSLFLPLRVGIVGTGLMGKYHARAAQKAGGTVIAIADIDRQRTIRFAADYPQAQAFADVAEMVKKTSPEVLHICTPTASHEAIAELAINAGINLFIEKPLAQTASETEHLYKLANGKNVSLCPVHQFAFQPGIEKAVKLLPRIGRLIHLRADVCSAGADGLPPEQLDLIAADILPHPLSLFQTFLNDCLPEDNWTAFHPQPGEIQAFGQFREISLSIFISMNARPPQNTLKIWGTNGTIYVDLFHGFAVPETGKVSKPQKILRPFRSALANFSAAAFNLVNRTVRAETAYPGLQKLVDNFYTSIRKNRESPITAAQAINVARIRDYLIYHLAING